MTWAAVRYVTGCLDADETYARVFRATAVSRYSSRGVRTAS